MHTSMWIFYSNKMTNEIIKSSKLLWKVLPGANAQRKLKQHFSFSAHLHLLAREFWHFFLVFSTKKIIFLWLELYRLGCNMHHHRDARRLFNKHKKVFKEVSFRGSLGFINIVDERFDNDGSLVSFVMKISSVA